MTPAQFRESHPDTFLLDPGQPGALQRHLVRLGWLAADEEVLTAARAGDGNMNCTVRIRTGRRSVVVKQSRPWVEKYPQFAAPWNRIATEAAFYSRVAGNPEVTVFLPRVLGFDPESRLLLLEDLGDGGDLGAAYRDPGLMDPDTVSALGRFLGALHRGFIAPPGPSPLPNREMRALNHAHIFRIPFDPATRPDLDSVLPGLGAVATGICADPRVGAGAAELGDRIYLTDGPCLLHGDFFPGSVLRTAAGPRVIDPEFAFHGRPEWDAGVFAAHLVLCGAPGPAVAAWWDSYRPPEGFDRRLAHRLAGVEILRRLFGYAQLPLAADLDTRRALAFRARDAVLQPSPERL